MVVVFGDHHGFFDIVMLIFDLIAYALLVMNTRIYSGIKTEKCVDGKAIRYGFLMIVFDNYAF